MQNPKTRHGSTRQEASSLNVYTHRKGITATAFHRILSVIFYGISRWNNRQKSGILQRNRQTDPRLCSRTESRCRDTEPPAMCRCCNPAEDRISLRHNSPQGLKCPPWAIFVELSYIQAEDESIQNLSSSKVLLYKPRFQNLPCPGRCIWTK